MHSPDGRPWIATTKFEAFELEALGYTRDDGSTGHAGDGTVGRSLGAPTTAIFTDWRRHPDGPLPDAGDEGKPIVINPAATVADLVIQNGGVMAPGLDADPGALYLNQDIGGKVRRLGAVFGFGPGTAGSSLAMVAFTDVEMVVVFAHIHYVVYPAGWQLDIYKTVNGTPVPTNVRQGFFTTPLPTDFTELYTEVLVTGNTATILLPDGSVATGTHADIGGITGTAASWEWVCSAAGQYPLRVYQTWADTQPSLPAAPAATVLTQFAGKAAAPARTVVTAANTLRQVTTSPVAVGSVVCIVGASGAANVSVSADQVEWGTTGQYYVWIISPDQGTPASAAVIRGTTLTGPLRKDFKLTGLPPGVRTFTLQHYQVTTATTGHGIRLDSSVSVEVVITAQGAAA